MEDNILRVGSLIEKYDIPVFKNHQELYARHNIKPAMAAVITTEDAGSRSYMRGIKNFTESYGIDFHEVTARNTAELEQTISDLNNDPNLHGIMVMYPTGFDRKDTHFMNLVDIRKDVEGLHFGHLGLLVQFQKFRDPQKLRKWVMPPTAKGILYILKRYYEIYEEEYNNEGSYPDGSQENPFAIEGKRFTIINDSLSVGRSLALMLLNENGSVQVCHRFTPYADVLKFVKNSDVIISAVPSEDFIIPTDSVPEHALLFDISFEGNFQYPGILDKVNKIAPRWDIIEKGDRINDMTLYRLISNLFYLINSQLPDEILKDLSE